MSTTDSKLEQHRDTEGPARRTYETLSTTWGFRNEGGVGKGDVSIAPMGIRTFWKFVGRGSSTRKDAMYEEVKP